MAKSFAIVSSGALALVLAVLIYFAYFRTEDHQCTDARIAGGADLIGGPFELLSHEGNLVTERDVITGPTLIYFGFTFCPDFCPLDISRNLAAIDLAEEQGVTVKPVFISIDPARDTVEVIADYVAAYDPRLLGLTGSLEQVDAASKAYRTFYRKNGEGDEDYLMNHSTHSYLMDQDGFKTFMRTDMSAETVAEQLVCFAKS
ncbi:MAG: SCO family protein [Pseudomonadota bacterium]